MGTGGTAFIVGIVIIILIAIIKANTTSPGRALQKKFIELGNFATLNKSEIIERVGQPNAVSEAGAGQLLQWVATGYHISILFDENGKVIKKTHEHVAS